MEKMGEDLIICGGGYGGSTQTSCVSSRTASGPWVPHSTTNSKRYGHSSVFAGGTLHLLGGDDSESSATMESFADGSWTEQDLPYSIGEGSCSVQTSEDSFILTGGYRSQRKVYEWKLGTWRQLEEMKVGRWRHASVTFSVAGKGFLVVAGGGNRNDRQSAAILDIGEGTWQNMGDLVKARSDASIVTVRVAGREKMLIMGGYDNNDIKQNSVEELEVNSDNPAQSTWKLLVATMQEARSYFGAISAPKLKMCNN